MARVSKTACVEDLRRRILTTDLAPGSDLDEATLSAHYGVSRTPLREVLQRLAGEGYVAIEANRGAKVASMDLPVVRTFFQTAPMIYSAVARLAAENRTPEQLRRLGEVQRAFRTAVDAGDAAKAALKNHAFHDTIGRMAANPYLTACLDRLLIDHARLGQTFYRPGAAEDRALIARAAEQHDEMIAALEARDAERSVRLALAHWDLSRDRLERFVRPDPLDVEEIAGAL